MRTDGWGLLRVDEMPADRPNHGASKLYSFDVGNQNCVFIAFYLASNDFRFFSWLDKDGSSVPLDYHPLPD